MKDIQSVIDICNMLNCKFFRNINMSEFTTFRVGGPADLIIIPSNFEQVMKITEFTHANNILTYVIGNGSNLLVSDDGIRGCVILLGNELSEIKLLDDTTIIAKSGANISALCNFALHYSLTGLEFAYGIPGTVGGAIRMNAGAYGGEIKDVLVSTNHINSKGIIEEVKKENLNMSYRYSNYCDNDNIITQGIFKLEKGDAKDISETMQEIFMKRKEKQPLEYPSAGSTFKRPEGTYAAELIQRCCLKGYCVGDAAISEKHAGFVINKGHATSSQIIKLIADVKTIVKEKTGYTLETEIEII